MMMAFLMMPPMMSVMMLFMTLVFVLHMLMLFGLFFVVCHLPISFSCDAFSRAVYQKLMSHEQPYRELHK
jgi:hypothetical protein